MPSEPPATDLAQLKAKLSETWAAGDYGAVAKPLEESAIEFLSRHPVDPGQRLLDVACGSGQLAIPAARAGAKTTGIDIAQPLIAQAKERAANEELDIRFDVGDVEEMPYGDAEFDMVVSLIGAMFAPRPERAAAEMLRVCRPGGRVVMGNWMPEGFIGRMFKTVGKHAPPPPGMPSPLLWGDAATARDRLRPGAKEIETRETTYRFQYPFGVAEVVEHYRVHFGPIISALGRLDESGRKALLCDLESLWSEANQAQDGTTRVDADILEIVAIRG